VAEEVGEDSRRIDWNSSQHLAYIIKELLTSNNIAGRQSPSVQPHFVIAPRGKKEAG
jgi:hypothetical protein